MTADRRNHPIADGFPVARAAGRRCPQSRCRTVCLVLGLAWMLGFALYPAVRPVDAQVPPSDAARETARRRAAQQQVRELAKRLVGEQLDLQMLQLRENGLDNLPLYAELAEMRANLDALVETHMQAVVALLNRLQAGDGVDERELLGLAREKSREILVRLLVERQRLLRRLKMAELESQVGRLIERQTAVRDGTAALPSLPESARPLAAVNCREDQRDVTVLYAQMTALLEDVAGWDAEVGREAAGALALLQEQKGETELAAAAQSLAEANWSAAVEHQNRAIETFQQLLARLRRASGLLDRNEPSQRNAVLEKLAARQEELRRRTELEAVNPETANRLVEEQLGIQKDLEQSGANLPDAMREPLTRAADAAGRAAEQLFQENAAEATQYQDQVLANIAEAMARPAEATASEPSPGASASQRDPMTDLEETAQALRRARERQGRASETALNNRISEAADLERQIASEVASIPDGRALPDHVRSAVEEAAQKVGEAAESLREPGRDAASQPSAANASDTLGQQEPSEAAQSQAPLSSNGDEGAKALSAQVRPSSLASDPSSAVTRSAEQSLEKALSVVETELADLARQRAASEVVATAREAFRTAANGTDSTPWFEQARQSAQKLADVTSRQLQEAQKAAEAVERHLNGDSLASSETLQQLEEARSALLEAAAAQQRAAGRPQAAEAILQSASKQDAVAKAREAAKAMTEGDSATNPGGDGTPDRSTAEEVSGAESQRNSGEPSSMKGDERRAGQSQVVAALDRARNALLREADSPEPAAALAATELASSAARQALEAWPASPDSGLPPSVAPLQRDAAHNIAAAAENVQEIMRQMEENARQELARSRQAARALVEKSIPVTPQATESLHQAESAAAGGMQADAASASAAQAASHGRFLDAAAAIAAREMQLKQALEAAHRLPTLLTPEAMTIQAAHPNAVNATTPEAEADAVSAALQALQELAATAVNPSAASPSSVPKGAAAQTGPGENSSPPSAPTTAASQADRRPDGTSPSNGDAGRRPASQSAASQGKVRESLSVNSSESESGGPFWMPQLPPEVRAAIRAAAESPPPPAYKERLRNYFKNVK